MTESIKQWIKKQCDNAAPDTGRKPEFIKRFHYSAGLSKGIKIAEGFAEWVCENYSFVGYDKEGVSTWIIPGDPSKTFWKSDLLEKYLDEINKSCRIVM